jgi:hypothetical protein
MKELLKFEKIINKVLKANLQLQQQMQQFRVNMSISTFAREFQTVHISIGRRSGKTTYIINNAKCSDVVLVQNYYMKKIYPYSFRKNIIDINAFYCNACNYKGLLEIDMPETIWIDSVQYVDYSKLYNAISDIYSKSPNRLKQIVIMT